MTLSESGVMAAYLQSRPVAIEQSRLPELLERARSQAERVKAMTIAEIDAAVQAAADTPLGRLVGAVAVIPIRGCITQKADFYSWYFGGTSTERLTASFQQYLNDPNVSAIVFDIDSPGGEVYGLQECFDVLFGARGQKKTFAVCNPFMASAAYFLGCAADKIWMTKSGQIGSIGCYTLHADLSKMLEDFGVKVTLIQYGEHKTEGNQFEPLSEDAHAELQSTVNYYGIEFDKAVAAGRGVSMADVKAKFGQGRIFRAPDAKKIGLIDQIGTRDELLAKLAPNARLRAVAEADAPVPPVVQASAVAEKKDECVEPNDDGTCPDGYEKDDDGKCYLSAAKASRAEQRRSDRDAIDVTLALTESV
jgi:capsid assembly protease